MKSSSNCFAGNNNYVGESKVDIATENVSIKSLSGRNDDNVAPSSVKSTEATKMAEKTSLPLPPWKQIGAKKATVRNDLDVVIAAPSAPAEDKCDTNNKQQHTMAIRGNSNNVGGFQCPPVNMYMGDCDNSTKDEVLLAELHAISMKSSSNCFAGDLAEDSAIQSHVEGLDIDLKATCKPGNGVCATMKAKSNGVSSTLRDKSFWGSFSKGTLVKMKAKGGPLPLPQPSKGMQVSSGANVGTGFPFVKKLISSNKDGAGTATSRTPAAEVIGTSCKVPNMVRKLGPGVGGGRPLPFIIKSPFNTCSKKGVESLVGAWHWASEILSSMKWSLLQNHQQQGMQCWAEK
jgi:hypothetical protein